jgi:hypothetical protein
MSMIEVVSASGWNPRPRLCGSMESNSAGRPGASKLGGPSDAVAVMSRPSFSGANY